EIFYRALHLVTNLHPFHEFLSLLAPLLLDQFAPAEHDVFAVVVDLNDLEIVGVTDELLQIFRRNDIDLRCRQKCLDADVHHKPAFHDRFHLAFDQAVAVKNTRDLVPILAIRGFLLRENDHAFVVFEPLEEHVYFITDLEILDVLKLGDRNPALGFVTDIYQHFAWTNFQYPSLDDAPFAEIRHRFRHYILHLHHKLKGFLRHGDAFIERRSFRAVKQPEMGRHSRRFQRGGQTLAAGARLCRADLFRRLRASLERTAFLPYPEGKMSSLRLRQYSRAPIVSGLSLLTALLTATSLLNAEPSAAEQRVAEAIKSQYLSVVHFWAPWCSNCQAELKDGGWIKIVKDNPNVHFYFVSVWNGGEDGTAMLRKFEITDQPNVTILADPGPRGQNHIKEFAGVPLSWIPTTWIYKGGDLRYALNYGEIRFSVLQQFLEDSQSEWSHKGEPKID